MAKWGEGDPRWIVEERPDATNVNNWHWTEKNAFQWSVNKLNELLINLTIENSFAKCVITEVETCEGEAVVNNRKGKLIFFYEWDLKLKWKGHLFDSENSEIEGTVNIPNLSEEYSPSEIDIDFTLKSPSVDGEKFKEVIARDGKQLIRTQLEQYVKLLKEDFPKGMILPKKGEKEECSKGKSDGVFNLSASLQKVQMGSGDIVKKPKEVKEVSVKMSVKFQCRKEEFYSALTVVPMVEAFTGSSVKMDVKEGGKFELFGGNIHGEFLELIPNEKICQKWRFNGWPENHFSTVTIKIEELSDCTEVKLVQTGVPDSEADRTKENWERYYWESIKRTFGYGGYLLR